MLLEKYNIKIRLSFAYYLYIGLTKDLRLEPSNQWRIRRNKSFQQGIPWSEYGSAWSSNLSLNGN